MYPSFPKQLQNYSKTLWFLCYKKVFNKTLSLSLLNAILKSVFPTISDKSKLTQQVTKINR